MTVGFDWFYRGPSARLPGDLTLPTEAREGLCGLWSVTCVWPLIKDSFLDYFFRHSCYPVVAKCSRHSARMLAAHVHE